jgi:hypothetical protein
MKQLSLFILLTAGLFLNVNAQSDTIKVLIAMSPFYSQNLHQQNFYYPLEVQNNSTSLNSFRYEDPLVATYSGYQIPISVFRPYTKNRFVSLGVRIDIQRYESTLTFTESLLSNDIESITLFNGSIILTQYDGKIAAYSQETGNVLWEQYLIGSDNRSAKFVSGTSTFYQNNMFVLTEELLFILNASTGKIVVKKRVPYYTAFDIVINPTNRVFYMQDGSNINCYELPKSIQ